MVRSTLSGHKRRRPTVSGKRGSVDHYFSTAKALRKVKSR